MAFIELLNQILGFFMGHWVGSVFLVIAVVYIFYKAVKLIVDLAKLGYSKVKPRLKTVGKKK